MPGRDAFETNFNGHGMPAELEKLRDFEEGADGRYFSDGFELTVDGKGGLASWSEDAVFSRGLIPFAQANGSGSFYALWANGSAPSEMPVIAFGDEGGVFVVAENVRGLLQLLTFDAEPMIDDEVTFYKDADDHKPSPAHDDYLVWLNETYGLDPIDDATPIVESAQRKHGEAFAAWLRQYVA